MRSRLERQAIPLLALGLGLVLSAPVARAERIHQYLDDDGILVFSNLAPGSSRLSGKAAKATATPTARRTGRLRPRAAPSEYERFLEEACELYRIPVALARAVMAAESNFDPDAVSPKGAQGLMQLMPRTAAAMEVEDAFDPRQNIHGGVRYLRVLANQFDGDMVKLVAAYNAGPDAVRRTGGRIPRIRETQEYVRRVVRLYFAYKKPA